MWIIVVLMIVLCVVSAIFGKKPFFKTVIFPFCWGLIFIVAGTWVLSSSDCMNSTRLKSLAPGTSEYQITYYCYKVLAVLAILCGLKSISISRKHFKDNKIGK